MSFLTVKPTPPLDPTVVGAEREDVARDAASFFAAHPFEPRAKGLDDLPAQAFFDRFAHAHDGARP